MNKFDNYMLSIADLTASMSKAARLKVGAVFSRDNRPLCTGWNGVLEGSPDDSCEDIVPCTCLQSPSNHPIATCPHCRGTGSVLRTKPTVIHAEMNALRYMARAGIPTEGATLYLTHAPCIDCAKHLAGIGLSRIVYRHAYRSTEGIDYLRKFTSIEIIHTGDSHG